MSQFISFVLLWIDSRSCHISATNCFDFFDGSKFLIVQYLIKIDNDFIQEANTFNSFVDIFGVKFSEVRNRGKKYSSGGTSVCIKLLRGNNIMRKIFNFVWCTAHGNQYLVKKKSKQIYLYRTKGTYCGYMGDCQTKKFDDSFWRAGGT